MVIAAGHQHGTLGCNLQPADRSGGQRHPIPISAVPQQVKVHGLAVHLVHLSPEIVQRHQQGSGEIVGFLLDVAATLAFATGLDIAGATGKLLLLVPMQQVVAELVGDREALAALGAHGAVV